MTYFVMALALVLGFTQCKKEQPTPQSQGVRITLNVNGDNSNSRVIVNPTGHTNPDYATVSFEDGDVIYVGYNNKFVGTLTYSGTAFSGSVNIDSYDGIKPLHFYFLGGVGFTPTIDETNNTATVNISNQTTKYPVISYAPSKQAFTGEGAYSAKLQNKVSIMKFNVTTPSTAPICITGMNNKVTLNFNPEAEGTDEGFTYGINSDDGGLIKMPGVATGSTETWAIVLPQPALAAGSFGTAYTEDAVESNCYLGSRPSIPVIGSNEYIVSGVGTMTMNTPKYVDLTGKNNYQAVNGQVLYGVTNGYVYTNSPGATVTLRNVTIHAGIKCRTTCTLVLEGVNTVDQTVSQTSAIHVIVGCTLTIKGSGRLDATGGKYGAGIGASYEDGDCGNIVIEGGIIYATGGNNGCAGIGGDHENRESCGNITISGGEVHATGGGGTSYRGAGIGCGESGKCGNITITGGTVYASGTSGAAGIGTASMNGECGNITITGGTVEATGGTSAAGIGTGVAGTCGSITITNDNGNTHVTATKGSGTSTSTSIHSIGIGSTKYGPSNYALGTVTIGGTVYYDGSAYQNGGNTYLAQRPLVYPQ